MLKLCSFTEKDIPLFTKWLNKDYVKKWYTETNEWLEEVSSDEFDFIHHFIVTEDDKPIGFCQYYDYSLGGEDWHGNADIKDTYSIDYMIGEEEYLGKGFGTSMIKLLAEKVFSQTPAVQVIVQPDKENFASRNTILSAGFCYNLENEIFILKKTD